MRLKPGFSVYPGLPICFFLTLVFLIQSQQSVYCLPENGRLTLQESAQKLLIEVLNELQKVKGITFLYEAKVPEGKYVKTAIDYSLTVKEILDKILPPLDLGYKKIKEGAFTIFIDVKNTADNAQLQEEQPPLPSKPDQKKETSKKAPVLPEKKDSFPKTDTAHTKTAPEQVVITGKVTGKESKPIPKVIVLISDTEYNFLYIMNTQTDSTGHYRLQLSYRPDSLSFIHDDYQSMYVKADSAIIDVTMKPLARPADRAHGKPIAIGYGKQNERKINSAISSVQTDRSLNATAPNLETLLQGYTAGVQVVNNSGTPGAEKMVRIRGNASLFSDNRPLYVVDGMPLIEETHSAFYIDQTLSSAGGQHTNVLSLIEPDDIESIEILKDGASSAIFGARGSNGVVLITTKQPAFTENEKGKINIGYNTYYGFQKNIKQYDLLNASEYTAYAKEAVNNAGRNDSIASNTGFNTDWQNAIFRTAPLSNHHLSLSAAGKKTALHLSAATFNQEGIIIGSGFNRNSARLNFNYKPVKNIMLGANIAFSGSGYDRVTGGTRPDEAVLTTALRRNPNLPVRDDHNNFTDDPAGIGNPVRIAEKQQFDLSGKRWIAGLFGAYTFAKNFTFRSSLSTDYIALNEDVYEPSEMQSRRNGSFSFSSFSDKMFVNHVHTLKYENSPAEQHYFSGILGFENQHLAFRRLVSKDGLPLAPAYEWSLSSFFGRLSYDFNDRYFVTTSLRTDGTSGTGGQQKDYALFPAITAGWRISSGAFTDSVQWMNGLKLRLSYGKTGNRDGSIRYNKKGLLVTASMDSALNTLPDAAPSWELTHHYNAGMDISCFNSRIELTANAYLKQSENLLMSVYVPLGPSEYQGVVRNSARVSNKGLELVIQSLNLTGRFKWNTGFNIAFNKNTVTEMPKRIDTSSQNNSDFIETIEFENIRAQNIYRQGAPFAAFYGYIYEGADPQSGAPIYRDLNKDGAIDESDQTIIGSPMPKHFGGLTNYFSYKNFGLDILLQWSYGNQVFNMTKAILDNSSNAHKSNATTAQLERWQQPGDVTQIPKPEVGNANLALPGSRWVEDGSYLRARNITLSYNFPEKLVKRVKLQNAGIYIAAINWFTFTKYSGLDPESQNQSNKNAQLGIDLMTYPSAKSIVAGIKIRL